VGKDIKDIRDIFKVGGDMNGAKMINVFDKYKGKNNRNSKQIEPKGAISNMSERRSERGEKVVLNLIDNKDVKEGDIKDPNSLDISKSINDESNNILNKEGHLKRSIFNGLNLELGRDNNISDKFINDDEY
jgi:hypothetical protein